MNYKEPSDVSQPLSSEPDTLEILNKGASLSTVALTTSLFTLGRLPTNTLPLAHPSISRTHALLQYRNSALYLYDLNSTHGTFLNKTRIQPQTYTLLTNGDMFSLGTSSRLFVYTSHSKETKKPSVEQRVRFNEELPSLHTNVQDIHFTEPKLDFKKWCQKNNCTFSYTTLHSMLDDESVLYTSTLFATYTLPNGDTINEKKTGNTKQDAEIAVTKHVLNLLVECGVYFDYYDVKERDVKRLKEVLGDDNEEDDMYDLTLNTKNELNIKEMSIHQLQKTQIEIQMELQKLQNTDITKNHEENEEQDELDVYMSSVNASIKQQEQNKITERIKELNLSNNQILERISSLQAKEDAKVVTAETSTKDSLSAILPSESPQTQLIEADQRQANDTTNPSPSSQVKNTLKRFPSPQKHENDHSKKRVKGPMTQEQALLSSKKDTPHTQEEEEVIDCCMQEYDKTKHANEAYGY